MSRTREQIGTRPRRLGRAAALSLFALTALVLVGNPRAVSIANARPASGAHLLAAPASGDASPADAAAAPLILESIEIEGNTRTPDATVLRFLPVRAGDAVLPESLLAAVDALRAADLFEEISVATRRGSERGRVILALTAREKGLELRFGAGYQDLSGWYLIPAELRLDNRLGRGERLGAHFRLGYRHAGLVMFLEEPRLADGRTHWGATASALVSDRIYFIDGIEYRHQVRRGGLEMHAGRAISPRWSWQVGAGIEGLEVDSLATAHTESEVLGIERGDELERAELPAGVAEAVGKSERGVLRASLTLDSRAGERVAGTPARGLWGRVGAEGVESEDARFGIATADLRAYRSAFGAVLAARVRAGIAGRDAPFHDRFYVGGLYTVRGFPSQSLSAPEGDTRFWSAALELRGALAGDRRDPRLAGLLFVEAADGWDRGAPALDDAAASAGFGARLRVPWFGWLGLDFGVPLTTSPVDEAFHAHASLGWTY